MIDISSSKIQFTKVQDVKTVPRIVHNDFEYIVDGSYNENCVDAINITKKSLDGDEQVKYFITMVHPHANVNIFQPATTVMYIAGDKGMCEYTNVIGKSVFKDMKNVAIIDDTIALHYDMESNSIVWVCAKLDVDVPHPAMDVHTLNLSKLVHTSLFAKPRTVDYVFRKLVEECGEVSKALNQPERCDEPVKAEVADLAIAALDLLLLNEIMENPQLSVQDVLHDFQNIFDAKVSKWAKQQGVTFDE